jgi:dodecin
MAMSAVTAVCDAPLASRLSPLIPSRHGCRRRLPFEPEEVPMSNIGRVTEITARSNKSFEDAVELGVERANKTLRNVVSAWVKEQRCEITDGKISAYQVNLLVTFILEE